MKATVVNYKDKHTDILAQNECWFKIGLIKLYYFEMAG